MCNGAPGTCETKGRNPSNLKGPVRERHYELIALAIVQILKVWNVSSPESEYRSAHTSLRLVNKHVTFAVSREKYTVRKMISDKDNKDNILSVYVRSTMWPYLHHPQSLVNQTDKEYH